MAKQRLVFLVPGFFGFTSVGAMSYFKDVETALGRALAKRGIEARIVRCATQPTASIPRRADRLRRQVISHGGLEARELHFIGHSTGGLDVRMLLTPDAKIAKGTTGERIARRTRTAVSVTTPHHGTPLANYFLTLQGHTLLLLLSALATSGHGRSALLAATRAIALTARLDDWTGIDDSLLDRVVERVLKTLRTEGGKAAWEFLEDIKQDQGAVLQLTPEGIALFDAAVADRRDVDYASVVAGVPPPRERFSTRALFEPERVALRGLFRLLHGLAARPHAHYPYPKPSATVQRRLARELGFDVTPGTNDGVVPTLSQLHGRLLHVARADHLDVVGHYTLSERAGDWLPSGAGFTPEGFEATWDAVAAAIAGRR
jgi:triacylglycerol lipase